MLSHQQKETLDYFERNAREWQGLAKEDSPDVVNTLRQRYEYGWLVARRYGPFKRILDVGCGAGDALWPLAGTAEECLGLDFAQSMIDLARSEARKLGHSSCNFEVANALRHDYRQARYDLILSYGLIEYFSREETVEFFDLMYAAAAPGARIVVESRNRLFNVFSVNAFTQQEIDQGNLIELAKEATAAAAQTDPAAVVRAVMAATAPAPLTAYPVVGVPVRLRHQYTPGELCRIAAASGFEPMSVSGYHFHGIPPKMKEAFPSMHARISNAVQPAAVENGAALAFCSSFMIHARKPDSAGTTA
jgi:2-polyprenyl-3-methyl-5-hydroxy-6-metoxy-1,4-benzoquinol methylase